MRGKDSRPAPPELSCSPPVPLGNESFPAIPSPSTGRTYPPPFCPVREIPPAWYPWYKNGKDAPLPHGILFQSPAQSARLPPVPCAVHGTPALTAPASCWCKLYCCPIISNPGTRVWETLAKAQSAGTASPCPPLSQSTAASWPPNAPPRSPYPLPSTCPLFP